MQTRIGATRPRIGEVRVKPFAIRPAFDPVRQPSGQRLSLISRMPALIGAMRRRIISVRPAIVRGETTIDH
jgi:hypothetical protein